MELVIRELTVDDYELYKKIRLELLMNEPLSFGSSFEEESLFEDKIWKHRLDKENVSTLGAFVDSYLVGLCVIVMNPRSKMRHIATLHSMYVVKEQRGNGIGKELICNAERIAFEKGVKRMNLSVVSTNENASNLYIKLGYHQYGLEPDTIYAKNKYHSLVLMTKELK